MAQAFRRIGKYELLEEIDRGGFAVVCKVRDVELDRLVALKVLRPALSEDPDLVAHFKQEARAATGLQHPRIVAVYDAVQIDVQRRRHKAEGRLGVHVAACGPIRRCRYLRCAGLLLIMGKDVQADQISALLGKPITIEAHDDALSFIPPEGSQLALLHDIVWSSTLQVRERSAVTGVNGAPVESRFLMLHPPVFHAGHHLFTQRMPMGVQILDAHREPPRLKCFSHLYASRLAKSLCRTLTRTHKIENLVDSLPQAVLCSQMRFHPCCVGKR